MRQGRIEVYDGNGNLRAAYPASGGTTIIGGQAYVLSAQPASVKILNIVNNDNKNYYAVLSLASQSVTGFASISIYLCNPSGCSSPIQLPSGAQQTGEVALPPGTSYVRLDYTPSQAGASASVNLHLRYHTVAGGLGPWVFYPISISLR